MTHKEIVAKLKAFVEDEKSKLANWTDLEIIQFLLNGIDDVIVTLEAEPEPLAEEMGQLYRFVQTGDAVVRLDSIWFNGKSFGLETGDSRRVRVVIYGEEK